MKVTYDDWVQWKERCAIANCEEETRSRMQAFVQMAISEARIPKSFEGAKGEFLGDSPEVRRHCASIFDGYMVPPGSRSGIRKKDRLLAATPRETETPTTEQMAACWVNYGFDCVRSALHQMLRKERSGHVSIDQEDEDGGSLGKSLAAPNTPSPAEVDALNRVKKMLKFVALSDREHLVLWADANGINRTGSQMQQLADCGKSQLSKCAKDLELSLACAVAELFKQPKPDKNDEERIAALAEYPWDLLVLRHRDFDEPMMETFPLDNCERLILWADAHLINRTSPRMETLAGCAGTQLSECAKNLGLRLACAVADLFHSKKPAKEDETRIAALSGHHWRVLVSRQSEFEPEKDVSGALVWKQAKPDAPAPDATAAT